MTTNPHTKPERAAEQGFMLVGLIVAMFLILLVLGVAAPRYAKALRREREVEAVHRGNQFVRAVQLYYRKTGHYPGSLEQLEKTNNIRFLRQRYADPMTGKPDWRLIHVGEAKTTVKGFFGKPLAGVPSASGGLGSAAGTTSSGPAGTGAAGTANSATNGSSIQGSSSFGNTTGANSSFGGSSASGSSFGASSGASGATGSSNSGASGSSFGSIAGSATGSTGSNSSGISSQSATSFTGTGAPIVGISSNAPGDSIIVLNEQTTYPTWEFLYDPRIEQMKAKAALLSGGPASSGSSNSSFGSGTSGFGSSTPSTGGTNTPGGSGTTTPTTPTTPPQ